MLSVIESVNAAVNNFIWGVPAMICIIGVGLYLSIRTNFLQIRKFPYAIRVTIGRMLRKREASDGSLTPFQAVWYGVSCYRGNGKHCRCGRCYCHRRTGSRILDVDFRTSWNVYKVFRSNTCGTFPRNQCQWRSGWRTNVLH